jgi:hypothetical protein
MVIAALIIAPIGSSQNKPDAALSERLKMVSM